MSDLNYFEAGKNLQMGGDCSSAAEMYCRALEADPGNAEIAMAAARALLYANRAGDAFELAERFAAQKRHDPEARVVLANMHLECGRPQDAAREFEAVLRENPNLTSGLLGLGLASLRTRPARAHQCLEALQQLAANSYETQLLRLETLAAEDSPDLRTATVSFAEQFSESSDALALSAYMLLKIGATHEAFDLLTAGRHGANTWVDYRLASLLLAAASKLHRWQIAEAAGRFVTTLRTATASDFYNYGSALFGLQRFEDASDAFGAAAGKDRRDLNALIMLMRSTLKAGRHEAAFDSAKQVVELDPSNTEARKVLLAGEISKCRLGSAFRLWRQIRSDSSQQP